MRPGCLAFATCPVRRLRWCTATHQVVARSACNRSPRTYRRTGFEFPGINLAPESTDAPSGCRSLTSQTSPAAAYERSTSMTTYEDDYGPWND